MTKQCSLFITFEGGEGSGKTSQINRLASRLTNQGYKVLTTREPGGTEESEKIRDLLVQRGGGNWSAEAETLLLYAARSMHVEKIIKPALNSGKIVICDRFSDSTMAYQGYGHGYPLDKIQALDTLILNNFKPDLTLILDIAAKKGLERSTRRLATEACTESRNEDRFEQLAIEFHEKLRNGFLAIAESDPSRCKVIDATNDIDEVEISVEKYVGLILKSNKD